MLQHHRDTHTTCNAQEKRGAPVVHHRQAHRRKKGGGRRFHHRQARDRSYSEGVRSQGTREDKEKSPILDVLLVLERLPKCGATQPICPTCFRGGCPNVWGCAIPSRDGNPIRRSGYPWFSYPMGAGRGMKTHPQVHGGQILAKMRVGAGINFYPRTHSLRICKYM